MSKFTVELGAKVKDKWSPFEGIVIGRHEYLYGCRCYSVKSQKLHEGQPIEAVTMDEDRIEVLQPSTSKKVKDTGGPAPRVAPIDR